MQSVIAEDNSLRIYNYASTYSVCGSVRMLIENSIVPVMESEK